MKPWLCADRPAPIWSNPYSPKVDLNEFLPQSLVLCARDHYEADAEPVSKRGVSRDSLVLPSERAAKIFPFSAGGLACAHAVI